MAGRKDIVEEALALIAKALQSENEIKNVKVGSSALQFRKTPEGTVELYSLRTPQSQRGKGNARSAMEHFLSQADALNLPVKLDASPLDKKTDTQRLVNFYNSLGFEQTGRSNNYVGDPEMMRQPVNKITDKANGGSIRQGYQTKGRVVGDIVEQALKLIFSGSKAVDEAGVPVRYYHGTTKDLPVIKPGTYFTEDPGEGSAYTFWTDLKNAEKHKGKYSVISAPELAGKRLEYFGTISDIDSPKVGEFYATDNGIMRYKGNGTWDVASDVGVDNGSLDMSNYTIGIKPYDNSEAAKRMVDEYEEAVNQAYPGGIGGNVIPAYLNVKNPKEMPPLEGNRFGERLGADPKWVADEIERLKAQGYDSIVTTSDDPFYAMEGKKPPKQYMIFDPTQAKSAIGNTGEYDFTNPDITKSSGGSIRQGYQTKGRVVGDIVDQALKLVAGKSKEVGPKALRYKNTPINAWHATEKPFTSYDWGLLGSATKSNVEGTGVEDWAMDLARVGPWSSEKRIDLGFGTHIPVTVGGKGKAFNSLDDLQRAIAKAGGPDKFRQNMTAKGFGHLRVADEEFGGTSYVSLTPETFTVRDDLIERASGGSIREGYGPGGWVDDVVKMAGKVISGEGEEATKAFRMPRVRPSTDNIHDVGSANFDYYDVVGNKIMPIKDVFGGVDLSMPDQRARVDALKAAMSDPEKGYISRIIVDDEGNVIEGQHRFDAFRELGAPEIPVTMLRDKSRGIDVNAMRSVIQSQGGIHPDQAKQIVDMILEGNPEDYEPPQGFEKWWNAGVGEYNKQRGRIAKGGGGGFLDDALRMAGKAIFGEGEDAAKAGIRAYHGSPHDFDRFDMSKIGTGEGAQAYGHGLYFAENEGVAKSYRDALAPAPNAAQEAAQRALKEFGGDTDAAANHVAKFIEENGAGMFPDTVEHYRSVETMLRNGSASPGRMYEVEINADPDAFLDWDKPLSEQPSLTRALGNYDPEYYVDYDEIIHKAMQSLQPVREPTGEDIYRALGHPKAATRMLNTMGVPGIRFLDAGSRVYDDTAIGMIKNYGSREKALEVAQKRLASAHHSDRASWQKTVDALSRPETRNLVVFDDKLISIIRKYGIAGASAMLGYNLMEQLDPKQALAASMADQDYQASRPQRSMGGNNSISGALNVARGLNGDR